MAHILIPVFMIKVRQPEVNPMYNVAIYLEVAGSTPNKY